eukprot:TRINITY_DN13214_c0_g1_i1.p2 TRINITY_DN13214_c0_g1~~TRINITY_DN13214_c0_g1_i1.p2  ORF type:complete len:56 (-),score=5.42 TRINITY_DN13214_c0_g1_i1:274-441(-)
MNMVPKCMTNTCFSDFQVPGANGKSIFGVLQIWPDTKSQNLSVLEIFTPRKYDRT